MFENSKKVLNVTRGQRRVGTRILPGLEVGRYVKMKLWLGGKIWDVQKIYDMGDCLYLNM